MEKPIGPSIESAGRVTLAHVPTPLEPLAGLTRHLGGPNIWIKRDDCTGLGLGGNKVRKLEFLIAEARSREADTIVTIGAVQSNHVRLTAAAARATGFESVSILFGGDAGPESGNLFLDRLLGSEIRFLPFGLGEATGERVDSAVTEILDELRGRGRRPTFIPAGGAVPVGCLGYLRAAEEMVHQVRRKGITVDDLVLAVGTGGTLAGLVLGVDALRLRWRILGHSVMEEGAARAAGVAPVESLVRETGALIGYEPKMERVRWQVGYEDVGEGYGILTPGAIEAIRLVARTDGVLLDPVYTGKAMAGLIRRIRSGEIAADRTVLFLHTGGAPALFAHPEVLPPDTPRSASG